VVGAGPVELFQISRGVALVRGENWDLGNGGQGVPRVDGPDKGS
jgi:hypothetical protein